MHRDVDEARLKVDAQSWQPAVITDAEAVLISLLIERGELNVTQPPAGASPGEVAQAIQRLEAAGLVGADAAHANIYRLLTKECAVVFLPDGRLVAGENNSGRLTRWVDRNAPAEKAE